MKTAIIYYSMHHGNTKKLLDAIAAVHPVTLISVTEQPQADLQDFDRIGIASGIYAGSFAKPLLQFIKEKLPDNKPVFLISTSAGPKDRYENSVRRQLSRKSGCTVLGSYSCLGFNTFGPTKLFGGTAKGHPTEEELDGAVRFYDGLPDV